METKLVNGDYVPDGLGGVERLSGADALLGRVLYRLTARRGQFPPLPELGSRLYLLGRETGANRHSCISFIDAPFFSSNDAQVCRRS